MKPLAFKTSVMSLRLLLSASRLVQVSEFNITDPIDLNIEAPPCVILCCTALEAFTNEISCSTHAFLFKEEKREAHRAVLVRNNLNTGITRENYDEIALIKDNSRGSSYERYKGLLKASGTNHPSFLDQLCNLNKLRDALVHFRSCSVPIIQDSDSVIRSVQESPEVFIHLKRYRVKGHLIVSEEEGGAWIDRASTNAMAAWSLSLTLDAVLYLLSSLPEGEYKEFVTKPYLARDRSFRIVFEGIRADVEEWIDALY